MTLPLSIVPGTDVSWTDGTVPEGAIAATVYLRPASGTGGASVAGAEGDEGWTFSMDAAATASLTTGTWLAQGQAGVDGGVVAWLPITRVEVEPSLLFTGDPGALDLRSPTEIELEAVRAAIQAVYGGQEYEIGAGRYMGRRLLRADLRWLMQREQVLMARLALEQNGGRSRRILIDFTP